MSNFCNPNRKPKGNQLKNPVVVGNKVIDPILGESAAIRKYCKNAVMRVSLFFDNNTIGAAHCSL